MTRPELTPGEIEVRAMSLIALWSTAGQSMTAEQCLTRTAGLLMPLGKADVIAVAAAMAQFATAGNEATPMIERLMIELTMTMPDATEDDRP
jgi:hypothetical protein